MRRSSFGATAIGLVELLLGLVLLRPASGLARTEALEALTAARLTGTWDALVQRANIAGPGVYEMVFKSSHEAYFVEAWPHSRPDNPRFFGRLITANIAGGRVRLKFGATGKSTDDEYEYVEIEGTGSVTGDSALIDGKIIAKHRDGRTSMEPVIFANPSLVHSICEASAIAEKNSTKSAGEPLGQGKRGQENILALFGLDGGSRKGVPRQVRIEYEWATYHVMCRGDRGEALKWLAAQLMMGSAVNVSRLTTR